MKKSLILLVFLLVSLPIWANNYMNLKQWVPNDSSNVVYLGYYVYNYNTYTVKVSNIVIEGWMFDPDYSATQWSFTSTGGSVSVYSPGGVLQTTLGPFNVNFFDVTPADCGWAEGVTRKANLKYQISYSGNETIPANGGYIVCNSDTHSFAQLRHFDWSIIDETDDYSSTESANLNTTRASAINYKYSVLRYSYDEGLTYQHLCERLGIGGSIDLESGCVPCSQGICNTPTVTRTTITTPTRTPTITITFTITPTATRTPEQIWYRTSSTIYQGSILMNAVDGSHVVDISDYWTWFKDGYSVFCNRDIVQANTYLIVEKHPTLPQFTIYIRDRTTLANIDLSSNTCTVQFTVFKEP